MITNLLNRLRKQRRQRFQQREPNKSDTMRWLHRLQRMSEIYAEQDVAQPTEETDCQYWTTMLAYQGLENAWNGRNARMIHIIFQRWQHE